MNYIDSARWLLAHYAQLKTSLASLEEEAATLYAELCPDGGTWRDPEAGPPSTVPRDLTETMLEVTSFPDLVKLRQQIEWTRRWLTKLDRAINSLPDDERRIVVLRYQQGFTWNEVERAMNLHRSNCHKRLERAVRKVAVALWGPWAVRPQVATLSLHFDPPEGAKMSS